MWYEIGDKAAFRKTGQALRENSAEFLRSREEKVASSNMIGLATNHHYYPSQHMHMNPQLSNLRCLNALQKQPRQPNVHY